MSLMEREEALLDRIREVLPGWRARGANGSPEQDGGGALARPPEVVALAGPWRPPAGTTGQSGGSQRWVVRIVAADLRSADARRGELFEAVEALRAGLAGTVLATGHSPLRPVEGSLGRAPLPLVWEEEFEEGLPASTLRPAMGSAAVEAGSLSEEGEEGATALALEFAPSATAGDFVLARTPEGAWCFLGEVVGVDETEITLAAALSQSLPALSTGYILQDGFTFPVGVAPASVLRQHLVGATRAAALDGSLWVTALGAEAQEAELHFAPLRQEDALAAMAALDGLVEEGAFLFCHEDGGVFQAALRPGLAVRALGPGLLGLELPLLLSAAVEGVAP